jgi:acyl-coenzyme A synthetase/AMP-(fatty) acid ligase
VAVPDPAGDGFGLAVVHAPEIDLAELTAAVPAPLVPSRTVAVDAMPRTAQGKPDRTALTRLLWPSP